MDFDFLLVWPDTPIYWINCNPVDDLPDNIPHQKLDISLAFGKDQDGGAHHAHKRSTNSQGKSFRITVEGSDFRYAFNWPGTNEHLLVFEAPIDMISFISMHPEGWEKHSYVALCGTSSQPMLGMLERYPQLQNVHLCLDND